MQTEQPYTEGFPTVPSSLVDQCFETNLDMNGSFQFETLLDSFQLETESVPFVELKMEEEVMEAQQPAAETPPLAPPASPESSDGSYHQQGGTIPRHKRPSHKRAELKRRDKIKAGLEELKAMIPSIADKGRMSEVAILSKAAEDKKHLLGDCEKFSTEAGNLRREIESLSTEIQSLQEQLPAAGLKQEKSLDEMYDDYCTASIHNNWKFFLFNFISKPLFTSFKEEVSTDTVESFKACVEQWTDDRMSLVKLRPKISGMVLEISRKTSIMTNPALLPEQALTSIAHPMDTIAAASAPSSGAGQLITPVVSVPPRVVQPSAKGVLAPPFCDVSQLSATVVPPSYSVAQLSAQVVSTASSPGVSQFNSVSPSSGVSQFNPVSPSSKHMELPHLHTPVTLGLSSSDGGHWCTPVTSTPLSSSIAHQSATRPTVGTVFANPHLFSSLPSTHSQNPSLVSFNPVNTVPQGLVPPQFSPPARKVSTSMKDKGHGQNHHHWSKPAARVSSRKRTSGLNAPEAAVERGATGDELQPVLRKRESLDRLAVTQPPPVSGFVPPVQRASQRSVGSVQVNTSDISQLAASVEGTSLYVNPPVAVVPPMMTHQEPTSVAHLFTDSEYLGYDFDITDILLPDL